MGEQSIWAFLGASTTVMQDTNKTIPPRPSTYIQYFYCIPPRARPCSVGSFFHRLPGTEKVFFFLKCVRYIYVIVYHITYHFCSWHIPCVAAPSIRRVASVGRGRFRASARASESSGTHILCPAALALLFPTHALVSNVRFSPSSLHRCAYLASLGYTDLNASS